MTGNNLMADKSKEKRKVIKQQTKESKKSMTENILLTKVKVFTTNGSIVRKMMET